MDHSADTAEQRKKAVSEFFPALHANLEAHIKQYNKGGSDFMRDAPPRFHNSILDLAFFKAAYQTYLSLDYGPLFDPPLDENGDPQPDLFEAKALPADYDDQGIITETGKTADSLSFMLRGGKGSPCSAKAVRVTFRFRQLSAAQLSALAGRISADQNLLTRCQMGYYDIRILDLCKELGIGLLPFAPEDFEEVAFYDDAGEMRHDAELARSVTPIVLLYLAWEMHADDLESHRLRDFLPEGAYFKLQGLNLRTLIKDKVPSYYDSVDTFPKLLQRPLFKGTADDGASLADLAQTDSLPLSDGGIFYACGKIRVPEKKYPDIVSYNLFPGFSYRDLCQRQQEQIIYGLYANYEEARRLAKTRLRKGETPLPEISKGTPPLGLHIDGVVRFEPGFSGFVHKKSKTGSSNHKEKPTTYDHKPAMFGYGIYQNCFKPRIEGVPEIYFFDGDSLAKALKGRKPQVLDLCCLWMIAGKLTAAGDFIPQLYYFDEDDSYSVRWIPDIRIEAVKELCVRVGLAVLKDWGNKDRCVIAPAADFADCPPPDPGQLGVTLLSKFIQSYVFTAAFGKSRLWLPEFVHESFPFTQYCFAMTDRSWYLDALFDVLKPLSGVSGGLKSVLLLEADVDFAAELEKAKQALAAVPAPRKEGHKTKAMKRALENLKKAQEAYDKAQQAQGAGAAEDPLFYVTLGFRDPGADGGKEYGEDEIPPVLTLGEVMKNERYQSLRGEIFEKLLALNKILPGLISKDKPRGQMRLSRLSEKIILNADAVRDAGFDLIMPREMRNFLRPAPRLAVGLKGTWNESSGFTGLEDLLSFDWQIAIGEREISKKDFEVLLNKAGRIVRFAGQYVYISRQDALKFRERLKEKPPRASGARLIGVALSGRFGNENVFVPQKLRDSIASLLKDQDLRVPRQITAKLRPYQLRGFRWLARNMLISMGSILADDMGLGKTLQLITALQYLKNKGELDKEKALIVVPLAVIINWEREILRFAPDLSCNLFYGQKTDPALIAAHDVTVTTYGTLRTHLKELSAITFRTVVLDEAQAIRNTTSQVFKAATSLKGRAMVAMTGTPVENRLLDYWAIMDFVNPGLLGTQSSFKKEIANPIEKERDKDKLKLFRTVTAPFILRRLKTDKKVIADLPDKTVTDRFCALTPEQAALYESVVDEGLADVLTAQDKFSRGNKVLNMILKLRQICNAPEHFSPDLQHRGPEFSGKAESLFEILDELNESGRKCLIFTQFKVMGDILTDWIAAKTGRKPQFIHGGVPLNKRTEITDKFQTDPDERILVLSLKAAGTGLNLTAATAVIHYDLWWNPAVEEQATDRTYRIGQRKDVQVFRLICANTFEEKINELAASKRELSDLTVVTGEQWLGSLDDSELTKIFRLTK